MLLKLTQIREPAFPADGFSTNDLFSTANEGRRFINSRATP